MRCEVGDGQSLYLFWKQSSFHLTISATSQPLKVQEPVVPHAFQSYDLTPFEPVRRRLWQHFNNHHVILKSSILFYEQSLSSFVRAELYDRVL